MRTGHIKLKNPLKAVKTPFKDYELPDFFTFVVENGILSQIFMRIEKKNITIKKGMIFAMDYREAKKLNLETIGEIQLPSEQEIEKDILLFNEKKKQELEIERQAQIAVAIITRNSEKLNSLLNQNK